MEFKEQYRAVFSQIHSSADFDPEKFAARKRPRGIPKKAVVLAAVIALLAAFSLTAYSINFFGLRSLLLPGQSTLPPDPTVEDGLQSQQQTQTADRISLVGYADTPEARATAEWQAFLSTYDDGGALERIGNGPTGFEADYGLYLVYTQEMADKLDEITAKYGLKRHSSALTLLPDQLPSEQLGGDFYGDNRPGAAFVYEDGTFGFDGTVELEGYGLLDYQFLRTVRGSFTDTLLNIGDIDAYTEWAYTTRDGTPVTLALSPRKALVIADLPDSFVTINVLAGTETPASDVFSSGPLTAAQLELFADSFTYSLLTPARPISADLLHLAEQQQTELETAAQFYLTAGMEQWQAQEFFAAFLRDMENDRRLAAAEKLLYPVTVTQGEETRTVTTPEELLPYYDDIFTHSLRESIRIHRYDEEHSDLFAADGLVGAANGAIWFGMAEGSMGILVVQNEEGCRVVSHFLSGGE